MGVYNLFKNKIYTSSFSKFFIGDKYKKAESYSIYEDLYFKEDKYIIYIKDENIGKKIYEIVDYLNNNKISISTEHTNIKIKKIVTDVHDSRVLAIYLDFSIDIDINKASNYKKALEILQIIEQLYEHGIYFSSSNFSIENCSDISKILCSLQHGGNAYNSNIYVLKMLHYILSNGKNFDEEYEEISKREFIKLNELNYKFDIFKMFYDYYTKKELPKSIYKVILKEYLSISKIESLQEYDDIEIALTQNLDIPYDKEKNKIYYISPSNQNFVNKKMIINNTYCNVLSVIYSLEGKIIGYRYDDNTLLQSRKIEFKFKTQLEIFEFFSILLKYVNSLYNRRVNKTYIKECNYDILNDYLDVLSTNKEKYFFLFKGIKEIHEFDNLSFDERYTTITNSFIKIFVDYIYNLYGTKLDYETLLKKEEIRALSPLLAREVINHILYNDADYSILQNELIVFLRDYKISKNKKIAYHSSYLYDPQNVKIAFLDEIEKEFNISYKKNSSWILEDGRRILFFRNNVDIGDIKKVEEKNIKNLKYEFKNNIISNSIFSPIKIETVIYSRNIENGKYKSLGYISTPLKTLLTFDNIAKMNNRTFAYLVANLFITFDYFKKLFNHEKYAYLDEENNHIYIDVLKEEIKVTEFNYYKYDYDHYVEYALKKMKNCGLKSCISKSLNDNLLFNKKAILKYAKSLDSYCSVHNLYYNSSKYTGCYLCDKYTCIVKRDYITDRDNIIYEDSYARHYKYNNKYNIKVYKDNVDISRVEKVIDNMLSSNEKELSKLYCQDLFFPKQKAILKQDNKFIGYIYDCVDFDIKSGKENICIDIKDLNAIPNVLRAKACMRLIAQAENLEEKGYTWLYDTLESVFISKTHKKQVQFANPEFLVSGNNTKSWVMEYIKDAICSDPNIDFNLEKLEEQERNLYQSLNLYCKPLTKKCTYHNMYYDKNYICCPKCLKMEEQKQLEKLLISVDKKKILSSAPINEGGESFIYDYSEEMVAKIFKEDEVNKNLKVNIISKILLKREIINSLNQQQRIYEYVIPERLLIDKKTNDIVGYTMKKIKGSQILTLRNKSSVREMKFDRKDVLEILISIARGIENLHDKANIFIGDLNGRNILYDKDKKVYFIDFDGMGIDNLSPEFFTDGYVDPVSKENGCITMKDDWYSFAIQAFYYLTYVHPFSGIYAIKKNNKEYFLENIEKMEKKISLLGNHQMKPPKICEDWNWMNKELLDKFLDIFEKDCRESMVTVLTNQYNKLSLNDIKH